MLKEKLYRKLLQLDSGLLKSDSPLKKIIKIKVLKPIGYFFRKLNYNKYYK